MARLTTKLKDESYIEATKRLLKGYKAAKKSLPGRKKELEILVEELVSLPALSCGDKVQTSLSGNPTEDDALELIKKKREIERKIRSDEILIERIETAVNNLSGIYKDIVTMRYIKGYSWRYLVDKLNYSERRLRDKENEAIKAVAIGIYGYGACDEDNLISLLMGEIEA